MRSSHFRSRFYASGAIALVMAALASSPARANCAFGDDSLACGTVMTQDTTYPASGLIDREYNTTGDVFTARVLSGATVSRYGLAVTNLGGINSIDFVNDGVVRIDAGNTASAGGPSALQITAVGTTSVNYSGTGDVINLGTAGNGLEINLAGTGTATATFGGDAVSAAGIDPASGSAIIVNHSGTAGDVSLTASEGSTATADYTGLWARVTGAASTGIVTLTSNATVSGLTAGSLDFGLVAENLGVGSVTVINNGTIGGETDRINAAGITAFTNNAASSGAINVSGAGAIFASGYGINAYTIGTNEINVNYTGAIDSSNLGGVRINATTGVVNVTFGAVHGATDGVTVDSTGTQTITLNGVTAGATGSGLASNSSGARTISVGGSGNVTGGAYAIELLGTGAATINNAGTIGLDVGDSAIASADPAAAVTITNSVGGTINGYFSLGDQADSFSNSGTWNMQGAYFAGGADIVTNNAGGVIEMAAGANIDDLETLDNHGTINVEDGVTLGNAADTVLTNVGTINLRGAMDFGAGADSFVNGSAGILNVNADAAVAGAETFTNEGRINLNTYTLTGPNLAFANEGFIDTQGDAALAGFASFANAGTLDLAAGTFTVPADMFTNSGTLLADEGLSTITGQTGFTNTGHINLSDGATNDSLTINSDFTGSGASALTIDASSITADTLVIIGAASGSTALNVNPVEPALHITSPLLVVDTTTSTAEAFTLATETIGLIDLNLERIGEDWYLTSAPNVAAIEPLAIGNLAQNLWYQSADMYNNYAALRRTDMGVNRTGGLAVWGEMYLARDKDKSRDTNAFGLPFHIGRTSTKRRGLQAGIDYLFTNNFAVGLTAGLERAEADIHHSASDFTAKGYNLGAYAMVGGANGFYGDLMVKYDKANLHFGNELFDEVSGDPDIKTFGLQGQLGYRFHSGSVNFDLGMGLAHTGSKVDEFAAGGIAFDFDKVKSTRGNISARATFGRGAWAPFVETRLSHEFDGDSDLLIVSGAESDVARAKGRGTWGRVEAGLGAQNGPGAVLAAWADFGSVRGFGVKAGWRFGGRPVREAELHSAPPPPPAASPQMQTCSDGSVVMATDICPPPAPPPTPAPPAAEPERG